MKPEVKRKSVSKKWLVSMGSFLLICLMGVSVGLSSMVSNQGDRLNDLEDKAMELKLENQLLEQSLVKSRSLTVIEPRASDMGFDDRPASLVISPDEAVAQLIQPN